MFGKETVNKRWFVMMLVAFGLMGSALRSEASTVETAYYAWDKAAQKITGPHVVQAIPVTDAVTTLEDGKWYVIRRDEKGGALKRSPLYVYGNAHLILEDGCDVTLDAMNFSKEGDIPAIYLQSPYYVGDIVSSISIYGQEKGNGRLVAIGGPCSAGIGTAANQYGFATVNIHGGQIEAHGGDKGGAAIGTGPGAIGCTDYEDPYGMYVWSHMNARCTFAINIYGGQVTARAAVGGNGVGLGFGSGSVNPQCAITVLGGDVTALGAPDCMMSQALGWGTPCDRPFGDPWDYDYLQLKLGRGMGLWTAKDEKDVDIQRMSASEYDNCVSHEIWMPYAHIKPAPELKVEVPMVPNAAFVVYTNGVEMSGVDGRTAQAFALPGIVEVKVVYTADDGYLLNGKRTWTHFVDAIDIERESDFAIMPPESVAGTLPAECVKPLTCVVAGEYIEGFDEFGNQMCEYTLDLRKESPAAGESYFYVAFRRLDNIGKDDKEKDQIFDKRTEFDALASKIVDDAVGKLELSMSDMSVYSFFKNAEQDFYAVTGKIAALAELPTELPHDVNSVYVFRTRAGTKGEEDAQVVAIGRCSGIYTSGRWSNELVGETVTLSYYAWDEVQGKTVLQAPVAAIPLTRSNDGREVVLHADHWYVAVGHLELSEGIRVDAGTAHLILAEGASLSVQGGVTVADDAALAIYSEVETSMDRTTDDLNYMFVSTYGPISRYLEPAIKGGSLEIHGGIVSVFGEYSSAIHNLRTVIYGGRTTVSSSKGGTSVVSSRTLDLLGGRFDGSAEYGEYGGWPRCIIAGEQDGVGCVLNVAKEAFVGLRCGGIGGYEDLSDIGDGLDVRLGDGVYVWSGGGRHELQRTTIPLYRARPKECLYFCPSPEAIAKQRFVVTAKYDENVCTNGFTLTFPAEELRPGEKWCAVGYDAAFARMIPDESGMSAGDFVKIDYAMMVGFDAPVVGDDAFARAIIEEGVEGVLPCFSVVTDSASVEIPASAAVDMVMVARVLETADMPVVSLGIATELQSMADGETGDCGFEFVTKQELTVERDQSGDFTVTMPEGDILKPGESWAWAAIPAGMGDDDEAVEMLIMEFGIGVPVGLIDFDMFMIGDAADDVLECGSTTEGSFTVTGEAALIIVGKTRPGVSMDDGPCDYLALTVGMASHLNVNDYADWPRHDEIFPNDSDYCRLTISEHDKVALFVMVDGVELGYRPDGVYTIRKGSEVRVFVEPFDKDRYVLRSPSVLVYADIQEDVAVGPQDVVVVDKSETTPIVGQGFVVRRDTEGNLTVDMSGEAALNNGEMWVCMTIDRSTSEFAEMESGDFFGDLAWRDCPQLVGGRLVGEVTLDMLLMIPGAENLVVTTNSVFAIPSDSELVMVSRAYDGYNGKVESERYYALSLGGVRRVSELLPGAAVEGERWDAPHQVRYSAWDGEKIVHGLTTEAIPLTAASFGADGRLAVTKDSVYVVYGRIRDMDNLVIDIADGVTLSLIVADGAKLELGRIHLPSKATLNLYGQDDCSGVIDVASYRFAGGMVPLVGGEGTEACGTINIHGGMLAVYDFREDLTKAAIGSCDAATGANGALNVYRGDVYVNGENAIGIGGYYPMQVRVLGGSITVEDGAIFGLGTKQSGISMDEGYQLLLGDAMNEAVNVTSVGEYEKLMSAGMPKKCVRIVRPAAIRFDAEIAALVASGKLTVRVICQSEVQKFAKDGDDVSSDVVWTKDGGTYALGCGDRAHVVFIANDKDSTRRSDVMSFACIAGDASVALADLKWCDQEFVAAQEFEVTRRLDGQFKLIPKGQLAEGEAWLWIALPEFIAKIDHPLSGQPLEETVAQQFEQMVKSGIYYIGGKFDAGGELRISRELRPLFNCFQSDNMGIPFLPMDGFHWGISKEKEVFYAPADSEFVMFCKVYDAGIAQLLFSAINEKEKPSKKAVKAGALTAKKKSSLIDEELAMMLGCRYMAESIGTATELQKLPRLPECEPGDIGNPWPLGPNGAEPVAYTNDTNTLVIKGKGPFAEPTMKPWLEEGVGPISEIVIKDPETELPDDIFEGLGTPEPIGINLPDGWPADDLPVPGQPWHGGYVKIEEGHWPLTISNVKFQQRYPWNGLVDITFDLTGSTNVELAVTVTDGHVVIAASNFVGRTDMKFAVEGQKTVKLVWDADKDALPGDLTKLVLENVTITVGTVTKIGAESAAGLIDLAKGARVARDIENIVIDPKWGDAASATVFWPKAEAPRTYEQATVAPWDTDRLPAGQYEFAYKAGSTDYTATFWLPADNWMVIDHETIAEARPVTGEKVLVAGESVIKSGGKLVIEGEPEIIWDGAFKVEDGGKIYAPYFNVIVDPETGLVTLEPKDRPTVTGLRFSQRYPWNGLVDVFFTASYAKDPAAKVWVKLAAKLNDEEKQVNTLYLAADLKTANTQFEVAQGEVHLVWDTMKDVGLENFGALEITAQAALIRMAEGEEDPEDPADAQEPLCFMAMENAGLAVTLNGDFKESPVLEYSTDGVKWEPVKFGTAMKVYAKEKVYLRGLNPKGLSFGDQTYVTIETKGKFEVSGDVMSLIDYRTKVTEIPNEYCFFRLFYNSSITTAPKLSASVLKPCCYWEMFYGSESLLAGPDLVAEFVPSAAYCLMFANCTSLSSVGCGANNVEFGDAFKSWLDNVMPKGVIYIIGNGDPVLLEKLNALPPDWGFGKPLKADTFEELKAEAK